MNRRPNFVVVMTDQQPQSHLGAYGNLLIQTPNMDALAQSGVRFDRGYTPCPLCTPARAAIFTGQVPERAGGFANDVPLFQTAPSMGRILAEAGYRTAYTGKWHLDSAGGYWGTGQAPAGWEPQWWYDGKNYRDELGEDGFAEYKRLAGDPDKIVAADVKPDFCWGKRVADRALAFLDTVGDDPFALVVSFDEPHPPVVCPAEDIRRYRREDMPLPATLSRDLTDLPELHRASAAWHKERWNLGPETLPDGIRVWYAATSFVDTQLGRILQRLDQGHAENTVVVFTSDHGDQLGAHGVCGKGPMMYEESIRVPFLVRAPGLASGASSALVSTLDILPTMCELAGIEPEAPLDGVSCAPVLKDPAVRVREDVVSTYNRCDVKRDANGGFYPVRAITDGRHKLIVNLLDRDEFYDLAADPRETVNRIDDPACETVRVDLHERLMARMLARRDFLTGKQMRCRPWRNETGYTFQGA